MPSGYGAACRVRTPRRLSLAGGNRHRDAPPRRGARPHRRGGGSAAGGRRRAACRCFRSSASAPSPTGCAPIASQPGATPGAGQRSRADRRRLRARKEKPPRNLTLDAWLRGHAARQHGKLFHDRPFLWWITDGRADGFTAVAHYHRLTATTLERLAYTVLGDWITRPRRRSAPARGRAHSARKLAQFSKARRPRHLRPLEADRAAAARAGTRTWTTACGSTSGPLSRPACWRMAERPNRRRSRQGFVLGTLVPPVFNGERRNDHHTTLAEKRAARGLAGGP